MLSLSAHEKRYTPCYVDTNGMLGFGLSKQRLYHSLEYRSRAATLQMKRDAIREAIDEYGRDKQLWPS
jgi:hypothetical protein